MSRFTQNCIVKPGIVALCLALAISPVHGVDICPMGGSNDNFNFQSSPDSFNFLFSPGDGLTDDYSGLPDLGGISLDRTLTLLNDIANIRGAAYDPVKGEVVFIGEGTVPIAEKIDIDDLVVALRSIYSKKEVPGVDMGPGNPNAGLAPDGRYNVTYYGDTKFTEFGKTLYEGDLLLKMLTLGIDAQGNKLSDTYPALKALGYESLIEKSLKSGPMALGAVQRFWFQPSLVSMELAKGATGAPQSFVFGQVTIEVYSELNGPGNPPPGYVQAATTAFKQHLNANYDGYAAIFPVLKKLKRLAKVTALVKWLYQEEIPVDMSFLSAYKVKRSVDTPLTTQILVACIDNAARTVVYAKSGPTRGGACNLPYWIEGGITYPVNDVNIYKFINTAASQEIIAALGSANRVLNAQTPEDMRWSFKSPINGVTTNINAIAQTFAPSRKEGAIAFNATDLALPNQAGQPIMLTRYYDSFSGLSSGFGPGWSPLPFSLQFTQLRADLVNNVTGAQYPNRYQDVIAIDRVNGSKIVYQVVGTRPVLGGEEAGYLSKETDDLLIERVDGLFEYQQMDASGQVKKRVIFKERGTAQDPLFYADPVQVVYPGGGGSDGVTLDYLYDTKDRLLAIVGELVSGQPRARIDVEYDGDNLKRAWVSTSAGLREAHYAYESGRLAWVFQPGGHVLRYTYEEGNPASGVVVSLRDITRDEAVFDVQSDLESRAKKWMTEGKGTLAREVNYDRLNGLMTVKDSLGRVVLKKRDAQDRLTEVTRSVTLSGQVKNLTRSFTYGSLNPLAGPTVVTDERGKLTKYTYDASGKVSSVIDTLGRGVKIEKAVLASIPTTFITDPKGRVSSYEYDDKGRAKAVHRRVNVARDGAGQIVSFVPEPGYSLFYDYDAASGGVATVRNNAISLATQYPWIKGNEQIQVLSRSAHGQPVRVKSASGLETVYSYDGLARLRSVKGPADVAPVHLSYYESGLEEDQLSSASSALGTSTRTYDVRNRQQTATDTKGVSTTSFYNAQGQLMRVVEAAPNANSVLTSRYFYDDFGRLSTKILPNGTRRGFTYDALDRPVAMTEQEGTQGMGDNLAPVVSAPPSATVAVLPNTQFRYDVNAVDGNGDKLTYFLVNAPSGMTIDPVTGLISWYPGAGQSGLHTIIIQAVDDKGGATSVVLKINISSAAVMADADSDAVMDAADNCSAKTNADQRDTDNDGFGNVCDADFNNDGVVNFADLARLKSVFGTANVDADFDGDGVVGALDLGILKGMFGGPAGPSGVK